VKPPLRVACVGGWGSTAEIWASLARALPEAELEVVPWWQCLGSGAGPLGSLLAAREPPALLVGWSLGAIALLGAVLAEGRAGVAPAVCLLSGSARMASEEGYPGADPRALRAMRMRLSGDPRAVLADFAALCAVPDAGATDFAARYVEQAAAVPEGSLGDGLLFLAQRDLRGRLGPRAVSVLWIHGECDAVIPVESARYAAARAPGVRLEVLSGRGHALPWTAAPDVARRIRGLLHGRRSD